MVFTRNSRLQGCQRHRKQWQKEDMTYLSRRTGIIINGMCKPTNRKNEIICCVDIPADLGRWLVMFR